MVFWLVAAAVAVVVAVITKKDSDSGIQIDFGNEKVMNHYDKYVWDPQYNPNNT